MSNIEHEHLANLAYDLQSKLTVFSWTLLSDLKHGVGEDIANGFYVLLSEASDNAKALHDGIQAIDDKPQADKLQDCVIVSTHDAAQKGAV